MFTCTRGIALPQGEGVSSYGTVVGEGGGGGGLFHEVRTPSSGVPSIAQLHRHLSNTTQGTQAYNYFTNKAIFNFLKRIC